MPDRFACDLCHLDYKSGHALGKHVLADHMNEVVGWPIIHPFIVCVCGFTFSLRRQAIIGQHLKNLSIVEHLLQHTLHPREKAS